jgi:hypothetical protein
LRRRKSKNGGEMENGCHANLEAKIEQELAHWVQANASEKEMRKVTRGKVLVPKSPIPETKITAPKKVKGKRTASQSKRKTAKLSKVTPIANVPVVQNVNALGQRNESPLFYLAVPVLNPRSEIGNAIIGAINNLLPFVINSTQTKNFPCRLLLLALLFVSSIKIV